MTSDALGADYSEASSMVVGTEGFDDWGMDEDDAVFEGGFRIPGVVWQRLHKCVAATM